ncbi:hypothetical protein NDU88_005678 [Pleurodeles waltl]|uniref:Uncharacterized protein n=1 Tax=Pleurodeles waltl TaxID=8319 RepID=A0AAV7SMB0_PLEWA|nr:hypothetical protein NDU88_005678 [Pleurodeles waltl]
MEQRRGGLVLELSWTIGSSILHNRGAERMAFMVRQVIVDTKTALQQDIVAISVGQGLLRAVHQKLDERVQETYRGLEVILRAQEG